jgi:RNase P/RNase MRP subunit p30
MIQEDKKSGVFLGRDSDYNRRLVESKSTKVIVLDHFNGRKDSLYQRDSGLNHVICKLAKARGIEFVIDLNELLTSDLKSRSLILGRISQNVMLFKKFGNKVRIISPNGFDRLGAISLLASIGMPSGMIVNALG